RMGFDAEEGLHDNIARNRSLDNIDGEGMGSEGAGYAGYGGYLDFDQQYVALEKSIKKMMKAMLGKVVDEIRKSIQPVHNMEENKYWIKEKMNEARDQFEYNEWCKVGKYIDSAILSNDWDMISKAREVVVTRAFVLRIMNHEGWNIAAEIEDKSSDDPMEALFHDKLTRVAALAPNQGIQWPLIQPFQPVQLYQPVQSLQSGFSPGVGPFFSGNKLWVSQQNQRSYNPSRPVRQNRSAGVVCFICEERGHITWDCPQKKMNQSFRGREYTERSKTKGKEGGRKSYWQSSVTYWEEKIKPAAVVIMWLKDKVPLFVKDVKTLVQMEVLKQFRLTKDELDWDYKLRLSKVQHLFEEFCGWVEENVYPAKVKTVRMFLGWLEMAGKVFCMQDCLGAIAKLHKQKGFVNPVENVNVKEVVRRIKLVRAQDRQVD
ncbi:1656_t:CDS:2, partial [Cetraspora pellucida]